MPRLFKRIRRHLADPQSHHRRVATGFLWVSSFAAIGKLAGAAKEIAVAWRYGISETVDAYVFLFNLLTWPVGIWFSVLTVVLVPIFANGHHETPSALRLFRAELLGFTMAAALVLWGMTYAGLGLLMKFGASGLTASTLEIARGMVGPLTPLLPIGLGIGLLSALTIASNRHGNTLLEALPPLAIFLALLAPPEWLMEPLIWGSVVGAALHLLGLGWPLWSRSELPMPTLGFRSPAWAGFWGSLAVMGLGQALMGLTSLVDQFFAASLGPGSVSILSYANRVIALMLGLGAVAISRAALPVFSELVAKNGPDGIYRLVFGWAKWMFIFGLLSTAAMWVLAPWLVETLFQRGAFTEENSGEVSSALRMYLLQIPFNFGALVLTAAIASQRRYHLLLKAAAIALPVKILGNVFFATLWGVDGIALATSLVYATTTAYLLTKFKGSQAGGPTRSPEDG
jgi:putative peptidoglycan lipid II flippase